MRFAILNMSVNQNPASLNGGIKIRRREPLIKSYAVRKP